MGLFERIRDAAGGIMYDEAAAAREAQSSGRPGQPTPGRTGASRADTQSAVAPGDHAAFLSELERLRGVGRAATATVLEASDAGARSGALVWCRIALQVQSSQHGYYRAETVQPLTPAAAAALTPGASRAVLVDPADRERIVFAG